MNLLIDSGNTTMKAALYHQGTPVVQLNHISLNQLYYLTEQYPIQNLIISSVNVPMNEIRSVLPSQLFCLQLNHNTPLPISVSYSTPHTLGTDRLAAACGAYIHFPEQHCLIIDAGTCITCDILDCEKRYIGGSISPGIEMRFKALHAYTSRLPLLNEKKKTHLTGNTTEQSMLSGVLNGVLFEIDGFITEYQKLYNPLKIIVTGGDANFFETNLKQPIFVLPNLVFDGLNTILEYNVAKK